VSNVLCFGDTEATARRIRHERPSNTSPPIAARPRSASGSMPLDSIVFIAILRRFNSNALRLAQGCAVAGVVVFPSKASVHGPLAVDA